MNTKQLWFCWVLFCASTPALAEEPELGIILSKYESGLLGFVRSDNPEEQAAAITGLAKFGSPLYVEARTILLANQSRAVKKALLEAIGNMRDTTPDAQKFVIQCLNSNSTILVRQALEQTEFKINFQSVWDPSKAPFLWSQFASLNRYSVNLERFTNVAVVKPWKDPAWSELSRDVKIDLLAKAGTQNAIDQLRKLGELPEARPLPENPDPKVLRQLLSDSNLSLEKYAAEALFKAKDADHIRNTTQQIQSLTRKGTVFSHAIIPIWGGVHLSFAIPLLDTSVLRGMFPALDDGGVHLVSDELIKRGKPISLREFSNANFKVAYKSTLSMGRLMIIIRDQAFSYLPALLAQICKEDLELLPSVRTVFALSPEFLTNIPASITDEICALFDQNKSNPEAGKLLGLFARGRKQEELWKIWKTAPEVWDPYFLDPVLWGFNGRSAQVREILGVRDFGKLEQSAVQQVPQPQCRGAYSLITEFNSPWDHLPLVPEKIGRLTFEFASNVTSAYRSADPTRLYQDFLRIRGINVNAEKDPFALIDHLRDPRFAVRSSVWKLMEPQMTMMDVNEYPGVALRYATEMETLIRYVQANRRYFSPVGNMPGPSLTAQDRKWLASELKKHKDSEFLNLIVSFQREVKLEFDPGAWSSDQFLEPSEFFVQHATRYADLIRELTTIEDRHLRYAAFWALWVAFADDRAIDAFMRDTRSTNEIVRAKAYFLLQKIRYGPATDLYPPLLKDSSSLLRRIGLRGITAFRKKELMEEVVAMTQDPELSVAMAAATTLGNLRSTRGRDVLIELLKDERLVANAAQEALKQYRQISDLDEFARRLAQPDTDSVQRGRLFIVATQNTYRNAVSYRITDPNSAELNMLIQEWLNWWKTSGRTSSRDQWCRSMLDAYVSAVVNEKGSPLSSVGSASLQNLFPNWISVGQVTPASRETVDRMWKSLEAESMWDILTDDKIWSGTRLEEILDFLNVLDPVQLRPLIFKQYCYTFESPAFKDWIFDNSDRFLPNPCLAACAIQDAVVSDWITWAVSGEENQ